MCLAKNQLFGGSMNKLFSISLFIICLSLSAAAQSPVPNGGGMALAPARFELEMKPGTETTVVVGLDYKSPESLKPLRIVASLNDWTLTKDGGVNYFPANTRPDSASSWLIYSPGEASVLPGVQHQIRVTVAVPANATPGDHLAALIVEQRPDTIKYVQNARQVVIRMRLASVFYIKVGSLERKGSFENLLAEASEKGVLITPLLKNEGNSVIRPVASISVFDADGKQVADIPESEIIPILGGGERSQQVLIEKMLSAGKYTVKYRVDFQDGRPKTEGVTDLVVRPQIAKTDNSHKKPE